MLSSDPETALSDFFAERRYDMLVLGALAHRRALTSILGTLTGKIVDRSPATLCW